MTFINKRNIYGNEYCWDKVTEDFDDVTDELECIFHRFIQYEEENFGNCD